MPALAGSSVSLRDYPAGTGVVVFSVDPVSYAPFQNAKRGSSHKVLSGSVIHQDMGLQQADFLINLQGQLTDYSTVQDLFGKFQARGSQFELRDWFVNRFAVVFAPGQASFNPTPIRGSCDSFEYTMVLHVVRVLQWFSGSSPF